MARRNDGVSVTSRILDAWLWVERQAGGFTKEEFAVASGVSAHRAHAILLCMYERQMVVTDEPIVSGRTTIWLRPTDSERGEMT